MAAPPPKRLCLQAGGRPAGDLSGPGTSAPFLPPSTAPERLPQQLPPPLSPQINIAFVNAQFEEEDLLDLPLSAGGPSLPSQPPSLHPPLLTDFEDDEVICLGPPPSCAGRPSEDPRGLVRGAVVAQRPPRTGTPPAGAGGLSLDDAQVPDPLLLPPLVLMNTQAIDALVKEVEDEDLKLRMELGNRDFRAPGQSSSTSSPPFAVVVSPPPPPLPTVRPRLVDIFPDPVNMSAARPDGRYSEQFADEPDVWPEEASWDGAPVEPFGAEQFREAFLILKHQSHTNSRHSRQSEAALKEAFNVLFLGYLEVYQRHVNGQQPESYPEIFDRLMALYPVNSTMTNQPLTSSVTIVEKFKLLFGPKSIDQLPSHVLGPMKNGKYTPSERLLQLYCQYSQYTEKNKAIYVNPLDRTGAKLTGSQMRSRVKWARKVIGSISVEEKGEDEDIEEWPGAAPPEVIRQLWMQKLKNKPNLLRILTDFGVYKRQIVRARKLIAHCNFSTRNVSALALVYLIAEQPDGDSLFELLMCAMYCGITSWLNLLSRNSVHMDGVKGTGRQRNPELYSALRASVDGGRSLIKFHLCPQVLHMSRSAAYMVELCVIAFLRLLEPCFNKQRGNSSQVNCPLFAALSTTTMEEIGLTLLLEGWVTFRTSSGSVWMEADSVSHPPVAPIRMRDGAGGVGVDVGGGGVDGGSGGGGGVGVDVGGGGGGGGIMDETEEDEEEEVFNFHDDLVDAS